MNYKNKPLLFDKETIPKIENELKEEIPQLIEELEHYINLNEKVNIKYNIEKYEKGYGCSGDLYLGEKLVKHYDDFDLLVYDLNELELRKNLEEMNNEMSEEKEND